MVDVLQQLYEYVEKESFKHLYTLGSTEQLGRDTIRDCLQEKGWFSGGMATLQDARLSGHR
ncbi:hypothetical protein BJB45_05080 [Halomonas huangheensis]|uniref:Uncharacterized protein n=1 Tax=Halomonas huangheensis TaxID=1178482 RepID=W1N4K1_9GAMM|nr:hypothetical protein AR456_06480 [Halomonas huangheensis]ERL50502.1 hypothetical protein BJB45_05080 [Halomonas huangheensis]